MRRVRGDPARAERDRGMPAGAAGPAVHARRPGAGRHARAERDHDQARGHQELHAGHDHALQGAGRRRSSAIARPAIWSRPRWSSARWRRISPRVSKTGFAEVTEAPPAPVAEGLKPGDAVADAAFLDQDGAARQLAGWRGHRVALTFVYTRCPLPEFCPLMDRHFVAVQRAMAQAPEFADVRLLTITMDPAFDTPAVLKAHAAPTEGRSGRRGRSWRRARTGPPRSSSSSASSSNAKGAAAPTSRTTSAPWSSTPTAVWPPSARATTGRPHS